MNTETMPTPRPDDPTAASNGQAWSKVEPPEIVAYRPEPEPKTVELPRARNLRDESTLGPGYKLMRLHAAATAQYYRAVFWIVIAVVSLVIVFLIS